MKKIYISLLLSIIFAGTTLAQLTGWQYRKAISITESSAATLIDYQLKLVVNTQALIAAGFMKTDGSDIRFTKTCDVAPTFFNYWIDTGLNTSATVIWVKVDTLLASQTKTIFMYYGNTTASAVSNVNGTFIGPHSSTDSVASGGAGGATNSQRGFRFSPNQDLLVTHFGKREPTGTTRYITLFDFATQAKLQQIQVSGPAAQYSYQGLANPFWLTSGTQYLLEMYQGPTDGYYFGNSSQIGQHMTYGDMRYCNSCTENTFPTNVLTNYHYGYPDLWYYIRNTATVLPTYTIAAHGLSNAPNFTVSANDTTICKGSSAIIVAIGSGNFLWSNGSTNDSITVSPNSNTTYSVTGNGIGGCSGNASISIIVNALPTVTAAATNDTLCAGQTTTLTGSGASTYTWNNSVSNAVNFAPTVSGNYIVTGTDLNACQNKDTVVLVVNALPTVTASATSTAVCSGNQATVNASGSATTYTWNNGVTSGVAFTPSATATYTVTGTNANACSTKDSVVVTVNALPTVTANTSAIAVCAGGTLTLAGGGATSYIWNNGVSNGVLFIPASTNTYIVTGTDANTCTNTASITIPVNALPIVTANATAAAICEGQSTTLTGGGAVSYIWNNGVTNGIAFAPTATLTYTVTGTDANTCSNTATQTVTVNANPVASLTAPVSVLCTGTPATLTGLPLGGVYSVVSGSSSALSGNTFNALTTGNYTIAYTFTNAATCSDSAQFNFNVNCILGLDNTIINNSSFIITPNPNNGVFTISSNVEVDGTVELINELGQVVYKNRMNGLVQQLNVQHLATGVYHLKVSIGNSIQTKRLSIVK
jgi:Domain of unknown function (DUF2341)/Secretion system C-terminal sorting domain